MIGDMKRGRGMPKKLQKKGPARQARKRPVASSILRDDVRAFKRDIILRTATDIFYKNGYQNSTVDDIAAAMSVSKAVVYYNFKSKEEVLENIVDRTMVLSMEALDRLEQGKTQAQKFALFWFYYSAYVLKNRKMIGVFFREERNFSPALKTRIFAREKNLQDKVLEIMEAGMESGEFHVADTHLTFLNIIGMVSIAFHWHRKLVQLSPERICRHFAEQALLLAGYERKFPFEEGGLKLDGDGA
jgi:AcrR family transcriptional regulator